VNMTRIAWCIRTVCTRDPTEWPKDASERKRVSIDATCCDNSFDGGSWISTLDEMRRPILRAVPCPGWDSLFTEVRGRAILGASLSSGAARGLLRICHEAFEDGIGEASL
jgi:hypothetical protein